MSLMDILTGRHGIKDKEHVPPLALGLAGLLTHSKLKTGAGTGPELGQRLEDLFKPSPEGGPTSKGLIATLLTGGLMDLVRQFQNSGQAETVHSWVSTSPNQPVSPTDLSKVLTEEQLAFLMARTGLSREELLAGLSRDLPAAVDNLTPEGRMPTSAELQQRL